MILVDALPKDDFGNIIFNPAGEMGGVYYAGSVGTEWFENMFPQYANVELPCTAEVYEGLKSIDWTWFINTVNWRKNSFIQVQGIAQDAFIEEEEAIINPPTEEELQEEGGEA